MKLIRRLTANAVLLGAMALSTLVIPAYGQQEVDPTYYPPIPDSATQTSQPATAAKKVELKESPAAHKQEPSKRKLHKATASDLNREEARLLAKK